MDTIYDLEVSKEDEQILRNNWKLISISQFINLFKNVLKIKEAVTPYDLEQSLLRPQHDPLCAELMSRLLQKRQFKKPGEQSLPQFTNDNFSNLDYDTWNLLLAKKFSLMFKNYRKFSIKYLGSDPFQAISTVPVDANPDQQLLIDFATKPDLELIAAAATFKQDQEEEKEGSFQHQNEQLIKQSEQQIEGLVQRQEEEEEFKEQQQQQLQQQNQSQSSENATHNKNGGVAERITRGRLAKKQQQKQVEDGQTTIQTGNKKGNKSKRGGQNKENQQDSEQKADQQVVIEQQWSSDIKEHLISSHFEQNLHIRFSFEAIAGYGQQNQWKAESLQIIKLFEEDLESKDPFYILGQDWNQKEDQYANNNYWSNFVDTENIEDFEDISNQLGLGVNGAKLEVQFRKFHEISTKQRLDILYFLCQNKLDSEQPEYMQELEQIKSIKSYQNQRSENNENSQAQMKMSEEIKQWLEPINMALLKELGKIQLEDAKDDEVIQPGTYYYFPYFSDTRIYRQTLDFKQFELYLEDFDQIQAFIKHLKESNQLIHDQEAIQEQLSPLKKLADKLSAYSDYLKKFAEEMKWKEASKVRKLKSQIRSRKLQDMSRKKLQFEGRQSQLQTDFLHHAQRNVMTRNQVDNLKSKINKNAGFEESKKRETRDRTLVAPPGSTALSKYQELQKEKYEKEKQDRQRRLEKRMRIKERIATGGLGKRKRRGQNSEDEGDEDEGNQDEYDEEYDQEDEEGANKRQRVNEDGLERAGEPAQPEYDIVLNGYLMLIFQRDEIDPSQIVNETMVIKGNWKLTIEEQAEEFIYKKIGPPLQEDLLTELFTDSPQDRVNLKTSLANQPISQALLDKLVTFSGQYQGYFKYNDDDITESFSFILTKHSSSSALAKKPFNFSVKGYGENNIGPFIIDGQIQILPFDKIQEKDGVKNFKKVKVAKFSLQKTYKKKFLEEMVEAKNKSKRNTNRKVMQDLEGRSIQESNQSPDRGSMLMSSNQKMNDQFFSQTSHASIDQGQQKDLQVSLPRISTVTQQLIPSQLQQNQQLQQSSLMDIQVLEQQQQQQTIVHDMLSILPIGSMQYSLAQLIDQSQQAQIMSLSNQIAQKNQIHSNEASQQTTVEGYNQLLNQLILNQMQEQQKQQNLINPSHNSQSFSNFNPEVNSYQLLQALIQQQEEQHQQQQLGNPFLNQQPPQTIFDLLTAQQNVQFQEVNPTQQQQQLNMNAQFNIQQLLSNLGQFGGVNGNNPAGADGSSHNSMQNQYPPPPQ